MNPRRTLRLGRVAVSRRSHYVQTALADSMVMDFKDVDPF